MAFADVSQRKGKSAQNSTLPIRGLFLLLIINDLHPTPSLTKAKACAAKK
jgi:hypothetical protein